MLSSYNLKAIAAAAMLVDHIGAVLSAVPYLNEKCGLLFYLFRAVGRVSFLVFAFLLSEGCFYTKDINKYLMRIAIFAVISQMPFNLFCNFVYGADYPVWGAYRQNIFFTWMWGIIAVMFCKKIGASKNYFANVFYFAAVLLAMLLAELCNADYGAFGVLLVFMLYAYRPKDNLTIIRPYKQLAVLAVFSFVMYSASPLWLLGALCAVVLIALYSGHEGKKATKLFYAFYPAHLICLVFIATLL
jgi:hypothetical protein